MDNRRRHCEKTLAFEAIQDYDMRIRLFVEFGRFRAKSCKTQQHIAPSHLA